MYNLSISIAPDVTNDMDHFVFAILNSVSQLWNEESTCIAALESRCKVLVFLISELYRKVLVIPGYRIKGLVQNLLAPPNAGYTVSLISLFGWSAHCNRGRFDSCHSRRTGDSTRAKLADLLGGVLYVSAAEGGDFHA